MAQGIVHVFTNLSQINFGVWNAALFGSDFLKSNFGINSCAVVCEQTDSNKISVPIIWAGKRPDKTKIILQLRELGFESRNSIVVTHGCWKLPTQIGYQLKGQGFKWVYTPHGMLEPWSMSHHRLKKLIYFRLLEKRMLASSDAIRAVSNTEKENLERFLVKEATTIENGVKVPGLSSKEGGVRKFVFMARLHMKKGIVPLVRAWDATMRNSQHQLVIAGPDEGELESIKPYLHGNIKYAGPLYGDDKVMLLRESHYYILPSLSEGFPTSVVEAMSYGMIPLISEGCNFPEVFSKKLGEKVAPDEKVIASVLKRISEIEFDHQKSKENHLYILNNFSEEVIGKKLVDLYSRVASA